MRILIVEDELDMLACLRSYFSERGHTVLTASTTEEALQILNRVTPDLAFVDLQLPVGSGRLVVQAIMSRQLPTRVIVMTGSVDLGLRKELLACGVSDYLFKPVSLRELEAFATPPTPSVSDLPLGSA